MPFKKNFNDLNMDLLIQSGDAILSDNFDRKTKNSQNPVVLKLKTFFIQQIISNGKDELEKIAKLKQSDANKSENINRNLKAIDQIVTFFTNIKESLL